MSRDTVAKKRFGQHFLNSSEVLDRIIESMPKDCERVIEIGPGLGDLTDRLLDVVNVEAYEIDRDLYMHLSERFDSELKDERLQLTLGDALALIEQGRFPDTPYCVVANLPYNVGTAIILALFEDSNFKQSVFMVQKEVAKRFCAKGGEKEYCALSVMSESLGEREILFDVAQECFTPPPKVLSSVFSFKRGSNGPLDAEFKRFLKTAFSAPRKKLAKNLAASYGKEQVAQVFSEMEIAPTIRPHQLDASGYHLIYIALKGDNGRNKQYGSNTKQQSAEAGEPGGQ